MTRPRYESESDLIREADVVDKVLMKLGEGFTAKKMDLNGLDREVYRGDKLKFILEVKTCNLPMHIVGKKGWGVAEYKWKKGQTQAKENNVPFLIAVRFTKDTHKDKIIVASDIKDTDIKFAIGGRKDRGDPFDIEPMVYVPMKFFKNIIV